MHACGCWWWIHVAKRMKGLRPNSTLLLSNPWVCTLLTTLVKADTRCENAHGCKSVDSLSWGCRAVALRAAFAQGQHACRAHAGVPHN